MCISYLLCFSGEPCLVWALWGSLLKCSSPETTGSDLGPVAIFCPPLPAYLSSIQCPLSHLGNSCPLACLGPKSQFSKPTNGLGLEEGKNSGVLSSAVWLEGRVKGPSGHMASWVPRPTGKGLERMGRSPLKCVAKDPSGLGLTRINKSTLPVVPAANLPSPHCCRQTAPCWSFHFVWTSRFFYCHSWQ